MGSAQNGKERCSIDPGSIHDRSNPARPVLRHRGPHAGSRRRLPAHERASVLARLAGARPGRALVGYLIFTVGLGIGDTDIFDWGGVLSALIGTVIVLVIATWILRRRAAHHVSS
jgi:hypothetical protein